MAPTEIKALARIIGDLDYYQLLHLGRDAAATEVKRAYHSTSRAFHPDANRHLEPELIDAVHVIAKRVSEAYSVLRDPKRRQAYDRRLDSGGSVRIQLAEAQAEAGRQATEELAGRTPQGRQFHKLAQADLQKNNLQGAARHLQTALTFESDNEHFKALLAEIREQLR
jgi:DnaJ-class molecular chaperone